MSENKELFAVMVVGSSTPSVLHEDYFQAQEEAVRLVKKERKPAYVLKAVAYLELSEVIIKRLDINS